MSYNVFSHVNDFNPVACGDSYKYSHFTMLKANVIGLTAYIEPRLVDPNVEIVMFGLQAYIKKYLLTPVQPWMLDEVEADLAMHGEPFDRETWESIINDNGGYLPLKIYAVPEGLPVPSNNILVRVDGYNISEAKFATLTTWIETSLLRAVWYGTTIATNGYSLRKEIQAIYARFGEDPNEAFFAMQDFAGRGVTCNEQAENGGGAHMVNFKGTDTFECLRGLRRWYNQKDVAGFSVWASEHTYEIIFGVDSVGEDAYIDKMLSIVETDPRCKILSIVIDGGDWKRCATKMCTEYRDRIIKIAKMGKKIVFRPDCYAEGTEILTNNGWIDFSEVTDETLVAQVDDNNNMTFTKPQKVIKQFYEGEMVKFADAKGKLNLLVTPNHRMVYNRKNRKTGEVKNVVEFAEDFDSFYDYVSIDRSAKNLNGETALSFDERLKIAFQADGSVNSGFFGIRFNLQKQRKIDRLTWILENLPYEYVIYDLADGCKEFSIKCESLFGDKDFAWVRPMEYNYLKAQEFIEELSYWDTHRRSDTRFKYDNTNKVAIDVVELVCMAAGYGCLISEYNDDRSEKFSKVYTANILLDNKIGGQSITKDTVEYSGMVYCVTVPTGKIVVKSNRGTLVCGNSGDMQETVPFIVNLQCQSFGYTENSKGLKRPKYVGCIQGDGVDRSSLINLLGKLISIGFAPTCTIFGSGGALLQKVCRDDFRFAMKVSAALEMINGVAVWNGYQKMTVGKQSKIGYITLAQNVDTGKYETIRLDKDGLIGSLPFGYIDVMRLVYDGCSEEKLLIDEHFAQIRERVGHTI